MKNTIVKSLIYDKQVRLLFADNTKLINEILKLNNEASKTLNHTLIKEHLLTALRYKHWPKKEEISFTHSQETIRI